MRLSILRALILLYHHKIPRKSISVLRLHQLQKRVRTVEIPQSITSIWSWTDLIVRDQISSARKKQMHGGRRALSRLSSTYRVSAIKSVPSPSPRGRNRATLLDLDAAMRTAQRGRDATHARLRVVPRERRTMFVYPRGSAGYRGTLHDESVFGTTWSLG